MQSQATVRYTLTKQQEVTVRLYDALGRQVRTVLNEEQAGRRERTLDVGSLPSGVYFLRLQSNGQTRTQKLTVVR
ncbi:T9SS type A sorting domain-containing protein [Salinibacter ruber]|uniref:T9SS type A sorting domain-containing protein n=1 Tax=Salinibacter ruber TaxID=146919 RepID=UPI002166D68E